MEGYYALCYTAGSNACREIFPSREDALDAAEQRGLESFVVWRHYRENSFKTDTVGQPGTNSIV